MAKRKPGSDYPPQVQDLVERSKSSTARKHHLVPAFYLREWANEDGNVRVSDKTVPTTYCKKPEKVAQVSNFYTLETDQGDRASFPPLFAETLHAETERWAAPHLSQLRSDSPQVSPDGLLALVWFLAIQTTRGKVTRDGQSWIATQAHLLEWGDASDEAIRRRLAENGLDEPTDADIAVIRAGLADLREGRAELVPDNKTSISLALSTAEKMAEIFSSRAWYVADSEQPLITSDEPIILLGRVGYPRYMRPGPLNAGVIAFPLAPHKILLMVEPHLAIERGLEPIRQGGSLYRTELDRVEALQLCREVVMSCHRWVFETPATKIGWNMWLPPSDVGKLVNAPVVDRDGKHGELVKFERRTRWIHVPPSHWPTGRWWIGHTDWTPEIALYRYRGSLDEDHNAA